MKNNAATKKIEATERLTPAEALDRNEELLKNREPQRWGSAPWVNH
jgi:hypothetical protein